jgi:hypothetical protein
VRHYVVSSWIYNLPFGHDGFLLKKSPGWANAVVGDWQLTGIWTWRTGFPISFSPGDTPISRTVGGNAVFNGNWNALSGNIQTSGSGIQYFNDAAAALAALSAPFGGQDGNRNILRTPGFWSADMALLKNVKLPWHEGHSLQFRAEAFNIFNHENFGNPNNSIFSSTFGQITATAAGSPARQMQFALRYEF